MRESLRTRALLTACVALLAIGLPACTLARGVLAAGDEAADGGSADAAVGRDASGPGIDAFVDVDAFVEADAFVDVDAFTEPDAYVEPDAFVPIDAAPPPLRGCDEIYASPTYQRCEERATECELYAQVDGTCDAYCTARGGTCLAAYADGDPCVRTGTESCSDHRGDEICVCSRIP